jgi:hypothetical protein
MLQAAFAVVVKSFAIPPFMGAVRPFFLCFQFSVGSAAPLTTPAWHWQGRYRCRCRERGRAPAGGGAGPRRGGHVVCVSLAPLQLRRRWSWRSHGVCRRAGGRHPSTGHLTCASLAPLPLPLPQRWSWRPGGGHRRTGASCAGWCLVGPTAPATSSPNPAGRVEVRTQYGRTRRCADGSLAAPSHRLSGEPRSPICATPFGHLWGR